MIKENQNEVKRIKTINKRRDIHCIKRIRRRFRWSRYDMGVFIIDQRNIKIVEILILLKKARKIMMMVFLLMHVHMHPALINGIILI